jgi:hypothetical protein
VVIWLVSANTALSGPQRCSFSLISKFLQQQHTAEHTEEALKMAIFLDKSPAVVKQNRTVETVAAHLQY